MMLETGRSKRITSGAMRLQKPVVFSAHYPSVTVYPIAILSLMPIVTLEPYL